MAKPWAKVQVGRMRHRKFLALNGNAIALWDEIKDYCDEHLTDGIVPLEAFKTFRFAGKKSMSLLTASCGHKPDGTEYAPLLEPHGLGFKMHDFLEHNDCRDKVLARMARAEQVKVEDRDRKAAARAAKVAKVSGQKSGESPAGLPAEFRSITEAVPERSPQPPAGGLSEIPQLPSNIIADDALAEVAGRFLDRYVQTYAKARNDATYMLKPARDWPYALRLVASWPDVDYLANMAELFLLRDAWKPKNEPGTVGQFLNMAPLCDSELRKHGIFPHAPRRAS